MNFEHPAFLWGLLFLAVPIIIHLFNLRRYKKVFFTNTKILESFLKTTEKTSKIKKRLLMASRLLAIFFAVLAFAQPFISSQANTSGQNPILAFYLDNSFSMNSPSGNKIALEMVKDKTLEIIQKYKSDASYQILTNNNSSNEHKFLSYPDAIAKVQGIQSLPYTISMDRVAEIQNSILKDQSNTNITGIWMSDFQKYQLQKEVNYNYNLDLVSLTHSQNANICLDTAYLISSSVKKNQPLKIICKLTKTPSTKSGNTMVTATINNKPNLKKVLTWTADRDTLIDTLTLSSSNDEWQKIKLSISDENLTYDNHYYLSVYISPKPLIIIISQNADVSYLTHALRVDDNFDVKVYNSPQIPNEDLAKSHLIILNELSQVNNNWAQQVNKWVQMQKNVLILLPENAENTYNPFLSNIGLNTLGQHSINKTTLKHFSKEDPVLQNIFRTTNPTDKYPYSESYYLLGGVSQRGKTNLIAFENNQPFLTKYNRYGEGDIYLMTSDISPESSDFVYSSLFAPLCYQLASVSQHAQKISYTIDKNTELIIPIENSDKERVLSLSQGQFQFIPPQRMMSNRWIGYLNDVVAQDGFYSLDDDNHKLISYIALNYPRYESQLEFYTNTELKSRIESKNTSISSIENYSVSSLFSSYNNSWWKVWVILAVLFLILEIILIKYGDELIARFKK